MALILLPLDLDIWPVRRRPVRTPPAARPAPSSRAGKTKELRCFKARALRAKEML